MKFLDGFKTILGGAVLVASVVAPHIADVATAVGTGAIQMVQGGAIVLTALGLAHKREKVKARRGN